MNLFISYSRADRKYAQELTAALRGKGFDVFLDYDSLAVGEDFSESILSSLRNAELVLSVVPKESGEGKNALYEVGAAKARGKNICSHAAWAEQRSRRRGPWSCRSYFSGYIGNRTRQGGRYRREHCSWAIFAPETST